MRTNWLRSFGAAGFTLALLGAIAVYSTGRAASNQLGDMPLQPNGAELFAKNCARCHGETGHGGKGPDLTSSKRKAKWQDSDARIVKQITKGGFFMPSFRDKLNSEQIKAIAEYVRTLQP